MSGHSKWSTIKRKKGKEDAKRGQLFSKLIRAITVAAKEAGDNCEGNYRLSNAIDKAYANNVSKDAIERAIAGAKNKKRDDLTHHTYEGYGPGGAGILVECLTDNHKRAVANIRHIFSRFDGKLGKEGSVSYLFHELGIIVFNKEIDEDKILDMAIDLAGIDNITKEESGNIILFTDVAHFLRIKDLFRAQKIEYLSAEITKRADNEISLDRSASEKMLKLLDMLDQLEDVLEVYTNVDLADEIYNDFLAR